MNDIKWYKIVVGTRNSKSLKQIRQLARGKDIELLFYHLMDLAGEINANGIFYYNGQDFAYTDEMLAIELDETLEFLTYAMGILQQHGMVDIVDNAYRLTNWTKYQNIDNVEKVKRLRAVDSEQPLDPPPVSPDDGKKPKEPLKVYGPYGWVKLKPSQYEKLKTDYPTINIDEQIRLVDAYVQTNGNKNKYRDFNLVIRNSIRDKWFVRSQYSTSKQEKPLPEWYGGYLKEVEQKVKENKEKDDGQTLDQLMDKFKKGERQ